MAGGAPDGIAARLAAVDTCAVSDALDRLGLHGVVLGLSPLGAPDRRVAGRVVTVKVGPRRDDKPRPHLGAQAIAGAAPGDVIVVDHRGRLDVSAWGGILSLAASVRGVAGVVVDGACRDLDDARRLGFPVFARAGVPVTARGRIVEEAWNEPVTIGGVPVAPGDYVVADASGVVFVAKDRAGEVVNLAEAVVAREAAMADAVRAGESIVEVMHDRRFDEIRAGGDHT
ncbi:MAG: RraA family protein [Actinomycetota bacterium]|nr:RraA family protein [Actinomycetota bacterium]